MLALYPNKSARASINFRARLETKMAVYVSMALRWKAFMLVKVVVEESRIGCRIG